jgi:hypothetical protein
VGGCEWQKNHQSAACGLVGTKREIMWAVVWWMQWNICVLWDWKTERWAELHEMAPRARPRLPLVLLPFACRDHCTGTSVQQCWSMTTRKWSSGTIKLSRTNKQNTQWLKVGENKEGNLENFFLRAQWPSVLYSAKSTEKWNINEPVTPFYSNHKDWLLSLWLFPLP